jgi:hypothetical protein
VGTLYDVCANSIKSAHTIELGHDLTTALMQAGECRHFRGHTHPPQHLDEMKRVGTIEPSGGLVQNHRLWLAYKRRRDLHRHLSASALMAIHA